MKSPTTSRQATFSTMQSGVLAVTQHLNVLGTIVQRVSVDVVGELIAAQLASKFLRGDQPMLISPDTRRDFDPPVSEPVG